MTDSPTNIYADLAWRGLIHQVTDAEHVTRWLASGPRVLCVGLTRQPTACMSAISSL